MAKSLRSKWKRKCRAVKRERYGKKELERLKKTLGITDNNDVAMSPAVGEIANFKTAAEVKEDIKQNKEGTKDTDEVTKKFDTKTLRDKNGAYPVWLHPRKIKKTKKKSKKVKGKKGKNANAKTKS